MAKYRSKIDFASIINGNKEGYNLGVDASLFIREQATKDAFSPPRIGTQGESLGGAAPLEDISALTDNQFNIAVDGLAPVLVTLANAGKTTGVLVAAELELKINTSLAAAGYDARVWVDFDTVYKIYSQSTGLTSSIVITDAVSDNIADDLKLGVANTGTETAGVDDQDFLLYTTGGAKFEQPIESNPHRSQRFHVGVIKSKIIADFDIDTLINMDGSAGASLDTALRVLMKSGFGKETVTPGLSIKYEQDIPNIYFSLVKASTIFAEYYKAAYVKDFTLTQPGDAPGNYKFVGFAQRASRAGIGQADGAVSASAEVILNAAPYKHTERFTPDACVMVVAADGRTITAGFDGTLKILSVDDALNKLTLTAPVDVEDDGFIVFWHPGAVQQTGRDNVYTDLQGSFAFNDGEPTVCVTNLTLTANNDHVDKTNCFGSDSNQGFIPGNRMTMTLEVTLDLSNDFYGKLVRASEFNGFSPVLYIGDTTGRHLKISIAKWIPSLPPIELPENGTTPVTLTGNLYQSTPGSKDPIVIEYL